MNQLEKFWQLSIMCLYLHKRKRVWNFKKMIMVIIFGSSKKIMQIIGITKETTISYHQQLHISFRKMRNFILKLLRNLRYNIHLSGSMNFPNLFRSPKNNRVSQPKNSLKRVINTQTEISKQNKQLLVIKEKIRNSNPFAIAKIMIIVNGKI